MPIRTLFTALLVALSGCLFGQDVPEPAPAQSAPILLRGGTVHTGNGDVFVGDLLLADGKIQAMGKTLNSGTDGLVINCTGKHIYPGIIAPSTQIGLDEIEAVRATEDKSEVGMVNPNARAIIAYNTDSRVTPTLRSNGILLAQIAPTGGLFAGTSSVVHLDAWNWEDAAYRMDDAVHLYWPRMRLWDAWWAPPKEEQIKRRKKRMEMIESTLADAQGYFAAKKEGRLEKTDLRWEAMVPVLKKEIPLFVHANSEQQIAAALEFMLRYDLRMVLVGGQDAWLFTEQLKQYDIPVILHKPHSLPRTEDDDVDISYKRAGILHRAGITVGLSMNDFWNQRNLPFQAGTVAAYDVPKEEALQMITLNTAKILGIDKQTGSIDIGKDANVLVSAGDLLDMRTSLVEHAFIQGRKIDLGNKQKDLYEKFSGKYGE